MAKKPKYTSKGPGGSVSLKQDDKAADELKALQKSLDGLGSIVDKASSSISQAAAGNVGSAVAGGASTAAAAIGGPELAVVAAVLEKLAPLMDKLATSLFPELIASLRSFEDIAKAGNRVKGLAEEAAAHGTPLSSDYLRERLRAESEVEHRRTREDIRVDNLVTELQGRQLFR